MKTFVVDYVHSEISFSVKLLNTIVKGTFESYAPTLRCESLQGLINAEIGIEIDAASLNTNERIRDQHLKSADFFDTDLYPKIYFTKTSIKQVASDQYILTGDLTIKNITHSVSFKVMQQVREVPTFICTAMVKRSEFDLVYNPVFEKINQLGDEVTIEVRFKLSLA